jgi:hypothetical protein
MYSSVSSVPGANFDYRLVNESALHASVTGSLRFDADELSPLLLVEFYGPLRKGKKGVILTPADVDTGMELRAPLSNQYFPGSNLLSPVSFYTQSLSSRIPAVSRAALSFFMCHIYTSPSLIPFNFQVNCLRILLPQILDTSDQDIGETREPFPPPGGYRADLHFHLPALRRTAMHLKIGL